MNCQPGDLAYITARRQHADLVGCCSPVRSNTAADDVLLDLRRGFERGVALHDPESKWGLAKDTYGEYECPTTQFLWGLYLNCAYKHATNRT